MAKFRTGKKAKVFNQSELDHRHKLGRHNVDPLSADDQVIPEVVVVQGLQRCRLCSFPFQHSFVVCPLCHNCQYCGLYNMDDAWDNCYNCGNTLPQHKHIDKIETISINLDR